MVYLHAVVNFCLFWNLNTNHELYFPLFHIMVMLRKRKIETAGKIGPKTVDLLGRAAEHR